MQRIQTLAARVRGMDAHRVDVLTAAGLTLASLAEAATQLGKSPRPGLTLVLSAAVTLTVALRRRAPIVAMVLACTGVLAFEQWAFVNNWMFPALALLLNVYSVAANVPGRRALAAGAGAVVLTTVGIFVDPTYQPGPGEYLISLSLFVLMPFSVGRALRHRRALTWELEARTRRLEREREGRAREAVVGERTRIARELHDVVAHDVSVMVIQAGAARRVAATDPDSAREALRAVQNAGRDALSEMRRMVGVLRREDGRLRGDPTPGIGRLGELAERARAAGLPVELRVHGAAAGVPAGVDLAAYRLVQEALTNAIKHAGPARARVDVRVVGTALQVEVADDGRGPNGAQPAEGGGHGLVGMRERLALYGGELEAGRCRGGGFQVRARIPLETGS